MWSSYVCIGSVAKGTAATSPVVPEEDCRGFGQMAVGQDVPELGKVTVEEFYKSRVEV